MATTMIHRMLLAEGERLICTNPHCRQLQAYMDEVYVYTTQVSVGPSSVTETLCGLCNYKRNKASIFPPLEDKT